MLFSSGIFDWRGYVGLVVLGYVGLVVLFIFDCVEFGGDTLVSVALLCFNESAILL